jgi:hypothetical protein
MKTHLGTVEPSQSAYSRRGQILGTVLAVLLTVSIGACTTTMYAGTRRPSAEIAVISSGGGTTLASIDGTPVDGGSTASYEVLPGEHLVRMQGRASQFMGLYTRVYTSRLITLCFAANPGHRYQMSCQRRDGWYAEIIDSATFQPVATGCESQHLGDFSVRLSESFTLTPGRYEQRSCARRKVWKQEPCLG